MTTNERQILIDMNEKLDQKVQDMIKQAKDESASEFSKAISGTVYWFMLQCTTVVKDALNKIGVLSGNN